MTDIAVYCLRSCRAEFEAEVPFPAVTLCNLNQFFRSRVPDDPGLRYFIRRSSEYQSLVNDSDHTPATPTLRPTPGTSGNRTNDSSHDNNTSPPPYVWSNMTGPELSRVVWNAAHKKSEFLYLCAWESRKIPCNEVFEERMTELGVCFTFNDKAGEKRRTSSTFGSWTGLRVLMIVDQDQYYFSKTMQTGIKVSAALLRQDYVGRGKVCVA